MTKRTIKFRGQTRRHGERILNVAGDKMPSNWVYGGVFQGEGAFSVIYSYKPVEKHSVYSDTIGQYTGLTPEEIKQALEEWLGYKRAEEEGLIFTGPCNLETPVFFIGFGEVEKLTVIKVHFGKYQNYVDGYSEANGCVSALWPDGGEGELFFNDFGKTVFLTREEAEKALRRMNSES